MKILFYINAIHEGGAERVVVNLASQFVDYGDDIVLVTSFQDTWEYQYSSKVKRYNLEKNGTRGSKFKRNVFRVKELRRILKLENPDCVVSFMAEPNYRAIIASLGLKIKTIISVRNDPNREYSGVIGHFLGKFLLPMANGCVFQTIEAQQWFPKRLQDKSEIIYNAVRKDFFEIDRQCIENTVVTCGRLVEQKNHKLLIEAFTSVLERYPQAKLFIYGEGKLKDELDNEIRNRKIEDNVSLCGISNRIPEVLSKAEIFVLSSDYEGMPNALMEAMAAGVACVSTDCPCGGPKSLISDKVNGRLVPVGNSKALSDVIIELLGNKDITKRMGENARKRSIEFYPYEINETWYKYIQNIVGK